MLQIFLHFDDIFSSHEVQWNLELFSKGARPTTICDEQIGQSTRRFLTWRRALHASYKYRFLVRISFSLGRATGMYPLQKSPSMGRAIYLLQISPSMGRAMYLLQISLFSGKTCIFSTIWLSWGKFIYFTNIAFRRKCYICVTNIAFFWKSYISV